MAKKIVIKKTGGPNKSKTVVAKKKTTKAPAKSEPLAEEVENKPAKPSKPKPKIAKGTTVKKPAKRPPAPPPTPPKAKAEAEEEAAPAKDEVIKFFCIRCGQKLKVSVSICGKSIKCPSCAQSIDVPHPL